MRVQQLLNDFQYFVADHLILLSSACAASRCGITFSIPPPPPTFPIPHPMEVKDGDETGNKWPSSAALFHPFEPASSNSEPIIKNGESSASVLPG